MLNSEEIKKALECCSKTDCKECPYNKNEKVDIFDITCSINLAKDTLNLINQYETDLEKLSKNIDIDFYREDIVYLG